MLYCFKGLTIDIMEPFRKHLSAKLDSRWLATDPNCSPVDLIESALKRDASNAGASSRYLLFLTENSSAIDIIQNYLINVVKVPVYNLSVICGSSFRQDQQYTEICRNISLIKHSMETGKTIILLNAYNLYESLYDALNQYYSVYGNQKFVDLGLGTQRVKCLVHDNFRLILIAEKETVYDTKRFPIPLINRLEKHFLNAAYMLSDEQVELRNRLDSWVVQFVSASSTGLIKLKTCEIFIGFHEDTTSSLILFLSQKLQNKNEEIKDWQSEIFSLAKKSLIKCATPDGIIRANASINLDQTGLN